MPGPPTAPPIGRELTRTAKVLNRAFEEALAAAGGSVSTWLILISLKSQRVSNQRQLADAVGIEGATLTHHLNGMESSGLITRRRDPTNRRVHIVELTEAGEALFRRQRAAAVAFDSRLRAGVADQEVELLAGLLGRLRANVTDGSGRAAGDQGQ